MPIMRRKVKVRPFTCTLHIPRALKPGLEGTRNSTNPPSDMRYLKHSTPFILLFCICNQSQTGGLVVLYCNAVGTWRKWGLMVRYIGGRL